MMQLPEWPRTRYRAGGGDAQIYYMVFGSLPPQYALDGDKYRCAGVPFGVAVDEYEYATQPGPFEFIQDSALDASAGGSGRGLLDVARKADSCILVHGAIPDPQDLNYLRDIVGLIQFLLDEGGVAVLDVQTLTWHSRDSWRESIFSPGGPVPRHHIVILCSEDPLNAGKHWYHTRGMLKYGRPDISVRNVSRDMADCAEDICNRLIEHEAFGAIVPEGQELRMAGLPDGIQCRHGGGREDPDFNNDHLEIRFPG